MKIIEHGHIIRLTGLCLLLVGIISLGGCKTLDSLTKTQSTSSNEAIKKNVEDVDKEEKITSSQESINLADTDKMDRCPEVSLVDELSELHQFRSHSTQDEDEKIARIHLDDVNKHCVIRDGDLAVNLTLTFNAFLGPRSRIFETDQPTISYPYFIAVTDSTGKILDKEIHGISLSFASDQSKLTHIERIQKSLDLGTLQGESPARPPFSVMIGFQLSPEELRYNQINRGRLLGPEAGRKPLLNGKTQYSEGLQGANSPI